MARLQGYQVTCCAPGAETAADIGRGPSLEELFLASRDLGNGIRQSDLSVPEIHCANCIRAVENALSGLEGVESARVNLSTRRVVAKWRGDVAPPMIEALAKSGYKAHIYEAAEERSDPELSRLVRAVAVAGFCSMNIMTLSVSVWSGADDETRQAFHWISALLALVCLLYSGRVFFLSAWSAIRHGRTNMDVPISIGVSLAFGLSLYDTYNNGHHAYFDALSSLIFFLLIGRTLDYMMRERARTAVRGLMRIAPRGATVLRDDGSRDFLRIDDIQPGMRIALSAGDRIPVDGIVGTGRSELDCAIATGESLPQAVHPGSHVTAGTLNLTGPLVIEATARAEKSFLAEMIRLMEEAEGGRARYRRLADRASALYSPVVHATAFLTFVGWIAVSGDVHQAITTAIAVLIITCPCALGLAVPIVQVVAARRLFENGIMVRDGSGIERLAEIDTALFDKTGTLTMGQPHLRNAGSIELSTLSLAAGLAQHSNHPLSRSLAAANEGARAVAFDDVAELPGLGIEGMAQGASWRLGRASWALDDSADVEGTVLSRNGKLIAKFDFDETLRPGAAASIGAFQHQSIGVAIISGDSDLSVHRIADRLGIADATGNLLPADKLRMIETLATEGHKTLMVGDGLNDTPALAAAHVSMAPASAADVGRNAADFVFMRDGLDAVPTALAIALEAGQLVRQNFALAVIYNAIALPVAILGYVTPLIAALAMSGSSVLVVANAMRLKGGRRAPARDKPLMESKLVAVR